MTKFFPQPFNFGYADPRQALEELWATCNVDQIFLQKKDDPPIFRLVY